MKYHLNIQISEYKARLYPLKVERKVLKDCDAEGLPITSYSNYGKKQYFYDELNKAGDIAKGKEFQGNAYKLVNGLARAKYKRTKELILDKGRGKKPEQAFYEWVDEKYTDDLFTECFYLVDCKQLKEEMEENQIGMCIYIKGFTMGNGYKLYEGFIHYDFKLKRLICKLGFGSITKMIKELEKNIVDFDEYEKIMDDEKVARVSEDDMFQSMGGSILTK